MDNIKILDLTKHKGRVFFTTDIHGCFDLLHEQLKVWGFDSTKDILIIGGDLCDRGPDSQYVLDYLNEPWIYCIRANHEQLLIQTVEDNFVGPAARCLYENGGEWLFEMLDRVGADKIKAIYESFKSLPLAIELILPNETIGVVHAQCPRNNWNEFKKMSEAEMEYDGYNAAQWSTYNYDNYKSLIVEGVDRLLVGHRVTESGEVEVLGNVWYCDLGSFFRDKICFLQLM